MSGVRKLKRRRAVRARPHIRRSVARAKAVAAILAHFGKPPKSAADLWARAMAREAVVGSVFHCVTMDLDEYAAMFEPRDSLSFRTRNRTTG